MYPKEKYVHIHTFSNSMKELGRLYPHFINKAQGLIIYKIMVTQLQSKALSPVWIGKTIG